MRDLDGASSKVVLSPLGGGDDVEIDYVTILSDEKASVFLPLSLPAERYTIALTDKNLYSEVPLVDGEDAAFIAVAANMSLGSALETGPKIDDQFTVTLIRDINSPDAVASDSFGIVSTQVTASSDTFRMFFWDHNSVQIAGSTQAPQAYRVDCVDGGRDKLCTWEVRLDIRGNNGNVKGSRRGKTTEGESFFGELRR